MITHLKQIDDGYLKLTWDSGLVNFSPWPNNRTWVREHIQEALDRGVVIEAKDPDPVIDLSDVDQIEKAIKALGLVVAAWSGKTPAQLKAAFKTAWSSLS